MRDDDEKKPVMPRLLNEKSDDWCGRRPSASWPVTSFTTPFTKPAFSAIQGIRLYSVASRQPGLSQLRCAKQLRERSRPNSSAYQVLPAKRPVECPGHHATRTLRSSLSRCVHNMRAISSMHASPVALSPTPTSQES